MQSHFFLLGARLVISIILSPEDNQSQLNPAPLCSKPCLVVELENEDPLSAKRIKVAGENKTLQGNIHNHCSICNLFDFPSLSLLNLHLRWLYKIMSYRVSAEII